MKLHLILLPFVCTYRYMTALTDSEEDELSDAEERDQEHPVDKLSLLIEQIDRLHQGCESDKRESLNILLEQREEVHIHFINSCLSP